MLLRLAADLSHLASIFILLYSIYTRHTTRGLSFKSQLLYLIVFVTRYLDLFAKPHASWSWFFYFYLTTMKIFFIGSSAAVLYLMHHKYPQKHNPSIDSIPLWYLTGPSAVLALLFHPAFNVTEILWSFSLFLEAVAILPQLFMLQRTGEAETITTHYLFALGAYRALYLLHWLYVLIFQGTKHFNTYGFVAGLVQTALYADFFHSMCRPAPSTSACARHASAQNPETRI